MTIDMMIIVEFVSLGMLSGLAAGLFGTGGGTVLIPFMLLIFHQLHYSALHDMHIAIGTSLALIVPTTLSTTSMHYQAKHLPLDMTIRWLPGILIGVLIGILLMDLISGFILKCLFSCYLLCSILYNFFKKAPKQNDNRLPALRYLVPLSLIVGCLSVLLGIGGGTFTVPILTFLQYPMLLALGISSLTSLTISGVGISVILYSSIGLPHLPAHTIGYLNWLAFLCMMPSTLIFSRIGVKFETALSAAHLRALYTGFLSFVLCIMLYHLSQSLT